MAVYLIGAALIYVSYLLCNKKWKNHPKDARDYFILTAYVILFLIAALRGPSVGIDTSHYMEKFERIREHSFLEILFGGLYCERVEFGYAFLNKLLSFITKEPYMIVLVNSAIVCGGTALFQRFFFDGDDLMFVIVFLCGGTFLQSLNVARQLIAVVLILNAWGFLTRKKYVTAAILFVVSLGFHIMAIVCLVMAFFFLVRDKKYVAGGVMALSFVIIACYRPILTLLARFISAFSYLSGGHNRITANGIWAMWTVEVLMALFLLWLHFRGRDRLFGFTLPTRVNDGVHTLCVPLFVIYYIVLTFIGTQFNYFNRFGVFFLPFTMLLFSDFGAIVCQKSRKLYAVYTVGLHVCFIAYLVISTYTGQFRYSVLI